MSGRPRRAAAAAAPKYVDKSDSEDEHSGSEEEGVAKSKKPTPKGRGGAKKAAAKKRASPAATAEPAAKRTKTSDDDNDQTKQEAVADEPKADADADAVAAAEPDDADNDVDAMQAATNLNLAELKSIVAKGVKNVNKVFELSCQDPGQKGGKNHKKWNEIVKYLVEEAKADVTSCACVAHVICRADNPDLVDYLISKGAKDLAPIKDCPDDKSWYFVAFWDRPLCAQLLLDRKWADLDNKESKDAAVALERAIWLGNMKILQFLLDKKVDVNMTISHGTPLTHAVSARLKPKQDVDRVKMLLAAGADKSKANSEGQTPLDIAKQRKKKDLIPLLE